MSNSPSIQPLSPVQLSSVTGGAGTTGGGDSQAQLRQLAQSYCPATYEKFKTAPQITRRMGERCLDEAGLGAFKGRLDQYFPRK
ncbi:MAG: hypothetical protein IPQ07_12975 [Myxococcales bacterium]|nr:hypothetical protein [Myxococcales bacterium]